MVNMLSIDFKPPDQILRDIGLRAKSARLKENMTRKTLAEKSGVAQASLKRFETSGQISLGSLVQLLIALDHISDLEQLLIEKSPPSIRDLKPTQRQRGRT